MDSIARLVEHVRRARVQMLRVRAVGLPPHRCAGERLGDGRASAADLVERRTRRSTPKSRWQAFLLLLKIIASDGEARLRYGQLFLHVMEGDTFESGLRAFLADPAGAGLARRRPDSLALLRDRATLRACPPGSLGRYYADFLAASGVDESYYMRLPLPPSRELDLFGERRWFRERLEYGHDLRHVLSGYGTDELGEICLLSFRFGETGHRGALVLASLGLLRNAPQIRAILEAFERGRRSRRLDLLTWEDRLTEPLAALRAELGVTPTRRCPTPYAPEAYPGARSSAPAAPLDLARTLGPMSAMHATLDRAGVGMPCGIVARFRGRTAAEVEAGVAAAAARFPLLRSRLAWVGSRPALLPVEDWRPDDSAEQSISLAFKPAPERPLWRYALQGDGDDVWLTAVWAHAIADGRSMLHFLDAVTAAVQDRPPPTRAPESRRPKAAASFAIWLVGFLVERHLPYARLRASAQPTPGVSWLTLPPCSARESLGRARAGTVGFGAWLAAAVCIAFCEHRGSPAGRISLNVLASRGDMAPFGGFGFAAGSLLMPVKLTPDLGLETVARRIAARQRVMLAQGWDHNLQRFIGSGPLRRGVFAALEARGLSAPTVSVSWKGVYPDLGVGGVSDIACFAGSSVAHVSAHMDANGLSISVASRLSTADREDVLKRIAVLIDGGFAGSILSLHDLWARRRRPSRRLAAGQMQGVT